MAAPYRYRLLLVLLIGSAQPLFAQLPQYQLVRIQEQDGLRTGEVTSLAKDRKGYLWVCTQSVAQRFDGKQTFRFPFDETVVKILAGDGDQIWVQTRGGVHRFSEEAQAFTPVPLPKTAIVPTAMFNIPGRGVHVLAGGTCFRFDEGQRKFVPGENSKIGAARFLGTAGKTIFLGNTDSIFLHDANLRRLRSIFTGNYYYAFPVSEEELMVSTRQFQTFLLHLPSGKRTPLSLTPPFSVGHLVVFATAPIANGEWLLGTNQGLLQYGVQHHQIRRPVFFSEGQALNNQPSVDALLRDDEGNILLNHADGLYLLHPQQQFIHHLRNYHYEAEALPSNNVRNFTEDDSGHIWIATTNGICRLDPQTGALKNFRFGMYPRQMDFPSYRQVLHLNGHIWIGTAGNGLWCYRRKTGALVQPALLNGDAAADSVFQRLYVWKLLRLRSGDLLAVGGNTAYRIQPNSLRARLVWRNPGGRVSRAAFEDGEGRIWHGTTDGLVCVDASFRPLFSVRDSFPDKRVAAFCECGPGRMLIGSRGLFEVVLRNGRPVGFMQKKGFPSHAFVYCMQQDRQGFVWLGTDEGLYRYDPAKDEALYFDAADGVQSQAFNSDAAFFSRNGTLYMGGRNGINYFQPAAFIQRKESLQPRVFHFRAGDSTLVSGAAPYRLAYENRSIDFLISVPEFRRPFRLQYRYRLTEKGEWLHNGSASRVRIGDLPPGDYRVQVAASLDGRQWFQGKDIVSFLVPMPWWQTTAFRVALMIAALVAWWQWAIYRRRRRHRHELQQTIAYFTYTDTAGTTVHELLWDIVRNCIARLGFEDCVIYLLDAERNMLVQKAALGAKSISTFEIVDPIEIPVGKGITGAAAASKQTIVVSDTSKDHRYIEDDARRLSEIAVPIVHEGRLIGVIDSEHRKKNFFTLNHRQTLETIASLCAVKLATALATEAVKQAEAELQVLNTQMREATFTNLRLQMNPHFLFNTLTTIQYLIVSNQVAKASRYLDIFSGFLRSLLNHAEDTVVTLEQELRILKLYVELESLCMDETFVWRIDVDDAIEPEDVLVPFMLLQPFVENAINHGLVHKVGEKRFAITVTNQQDRCFECLIEDNGIGRRASEAINHQKMRSHLHESKGLQIVRQRLQLLQQKTGKEAGLEIEDLYAGNLPAGTRIRLLIPYYQTCDV